MSTEPFPNPLTISEQIREIEPGGYCFIEGAAASTVHSLLVRIKGETNGIYRAKKADGGVRVWRFAEEKR